MITIPQPYVIELRVNILNKKFKSFTYTIIFWSWRNFFFKCQISS